MRKTVVVTENDAMYDELIEKATKALAPENIRVIARSEKNAKKGFHSIRKCGIKFYVAGSVSDGEDSCSVYKKDWTDDELEIAIENTARDVIVTCFSDLLMERNGDNLENWKPNMNEPFFILTNKSRVNGAGVLLCDDVLREVFRKVGPYFILPSSIHEVLVFPETDRTKGRELSAMVKQINGDVVADEDVLSDEAFFYDGNNWTA